MTYTLTITSDSPTAMNFIKYAKSLDFVKVTKTKASKKTVATPEVLEEDEDGMPIAYKDFILELSQKTKKAATKRFYEKVAKNDIL